MKQWIPADRFLAVIDTKSTLDLDELERRQINRLRSGEAKTVSLDYADRMLTRLDLIHWFHIPAEDGGLADIYEDDLRRRCACHGMPMQKNGRGRWRCSVRNNLRMMLAYALGDAA